MKVVVCTGHREMKQGHELAVWQQVQESIRTADEMVFGGAMGFDTLALEAAWTWKSFARNPEFAAYAKLHYPATADCKLTVVVAAKLENQPMESRTRMGWMERVNSGLIDVIELGLSYDADGLKQRNRVMVDRIPSAEEGYVLAYYSGNKQSGTWSTIRYARDVKGYVAKRILIEEPKKTEHPF